MLAIYALIIIPLFIDNNSTVEASGNENNATVETSENENADHMQIINVYTSILFRDVNNFNDIGNMNSAQEQIAYFFYKKFCWSILNNYEHMERETDEFRAYFQQIQNDYIVFSSEQTAIRESKLCEFYKMFVRIIFDKILEKNEHWREYLRFQIRHFFWLDNQWEIKTEEFLKNINCQSKENCTEIEWEYLKEYLAKKSQTNLANYCLLEWLIGNSWEFIGIIVNKSDEKFMEMKRRIFILTGPIGFDRLELAKTNVLKIGSPLFEFVQFCLKRFLIGMEDSRRYKLRMSISLLMNNFIKFRKSIADTEKQSNEENMRTILAINMDKLDKINRLINSIADLNNVNFVQDESKLEQVLCILLKLYEISDDGMPKINIKKFVEMTEDELLNNTNADLELMENKEKILAPIYLRVIPTQLANADEEMQNILKNGDGSIYRLASLIGGNDHLLEIWRNYKEKIRSTDFFNIDIDKRTREYYEILFTDEKVTNQILSRTNLNIFLLMNNIEKMVRKSKSFTLLLENLRCMFRFKIDFLHVKPEPEYLIGTDIELTIKENYFYSVLILVNYSMVEERIRIQINVYLRNLILEYAEKWMNKKRSIKITQNEFYELNMEKDKEIKELLKSYDNELPALSPSFQNIHINQLAKLAEEDKRKNINDNDAKIFNFWHFFQKFSSNQDEKIKSRLYFILNEDGIEKLMEKILGSLNNDDSKLTKIDEPPHSTVKKLKKGKKKKKTTAEEQSLSQKEASSADVAISSSESQNTLTKADLELVLDASEELRMNVIDAYLEMLTRDNVQNYGFIPGYVIHCFRNEEKFPPKWLQIILQQNILDDVRYWLIPAQFNTNHWVLSVMDIPENRLYYFDFLLPGSIDNEFIMDIFKMFQDLYTISGYPISEQFVSMDNLEIASESDLPKQKNTINCGIFMLIYARYILGKSNTKTEMHINQGGVKEARKRIYQELMADRFGINVDDDVIETQFILRSSKLSELPLKESENEAEPSKKILLQSEIEDLQDKSKLLFESQLHQENPSPQSKLERRRSIDEMPKEKTNDKTTDLIKNLYNALIFNNDYNEFARINIGVAYFHFKNLAFSILMEFKQNHMAIVYETFLKEIDKSYDEFQKLIKINYTFEKLACIFFKFFMQLRSNKILTRIEEWNNYIHFRMRHFYWIDPNWDESANLLIKNLIMEETNNCSLGEIKHFSKNIANVRPYSTISHWWTLKWLLQNSPEFIEKFNKQSGELLLILKKRIFDLLGENGFDRLEMAIPALKFHTALQDMARISITRYLSGGLVGTKYQLRLALSYLLHHFLLYRARCKIGFGTSEDKELMSHIEKLNKICEHIVNVKLVRLIDEEHTLEEEVHGLKEALCILLKFFEITETEPIVTTENVTSISFEQVLQCTADQIEGTLERQRFVLKFYHYNSMEKHLLAGDKNLENVLKYTNGAIYRLKKLIGYDKLLELWNKYRENIRDRKYFANTLNQIRQSFELFLATKDDHIRQLNRTKLKIYILMRWLDHTLQNNRIFTELLSSWHLIFRVFLDQLTVQPNQVEKVEIKCTIRGGNIIEFVQKWRGKPRNEQFRNEFNSKQIEIDHWINYYLAKKEVPTLMDGFQLIHLLTLEELAIQDKTCKTKTNMGKGNEFNFWQYFNDLYNHPDRITRIGELLNLNSLKQLHELLGIKFIASRFNQLGELALSKIEIEKENKLHKNLLSSDSQQEGGPSKSGKKKLKKNKSKMSKTSNNEEEIGIRDSESPKEVPPEITLEGKGCIKGVKETFSPKGKTLEKKGNKKEETRISPKLKSLEGKESEKEVMGKSHKIIEESSVNKNKRKEQRRKNLTRFNKEFGKPNQIKSPLRRTESAPSGSQIQNGISLKKSEITKFQRISRSQSTEKQRPGQSFQKIVKINILKDYKFEDLMQLDTLNMHYKELMNDSNNQEKRRFTDIAVFAVEIDQRLKALEIYTKLWREKESEFNKFHKVVKNLTFNTFDDINKLEEYLYNLLKKIEIAMENPINLGKNEMANDKEENIYEIRKQLHGLRFASIFQNDLNWQNVESKDLNRILFALNLQAGKKFNEQIKIWQTISDQLKLDNQLYFERRIKENGKELFDFAKYSQQLWFGDQNKKEKELTESLIKEFKFVDVNDIELGIPIKYLWMRKYMQTKERVKDIVKQWHSTAEILFTGSHLLGTMTSRSDMDTIVVTYDVQIYDYNQQAECIIEERFDEEKKMFQRTRICENDQLFICKLCKIDRLISAIKIPGSVELLKAFFCEDENYELKSFNQCKYKVKVDFLFATVQKKDYLSILKTKDVTSQEIDKILVELYKFYDSRQSFLALLGLRDNIRILEQFPTDGKNFRIACAALKLWAKRNNIYGPKLGFLKGVHMNLLMAKIYLRYPSASVPFLIEQFFATYIVWPWPMPVQLVPISKLTYERSGSQNLLWYIKEPNAEMPIISPGFIESNKATDVDHYTKSIIRTFMGEGLKQIREIRAGKVESGKEWHDFMRGHDLAKKYEHYLVVSCITKVSEGTFGDDFCAIVSLKMHDFIPVEIGKIFPKEIRWYHIIEAGSRKKCLINRNGYEHEDISNYKCDVWLVGLQLKKDKQIDPEEIINLENKKEMSEAKEKMYNDYIVYKKRFNIKWRTIRENDENFLKEKLLLSINYVGLNDLPSWNIQLRGWEVIVKN